MGVGGIGDNPGQGCFTAARRAVKYKRGKLVGLNGAAQQAARTNDMLLADKLIQGTGPHAGRQRRFFFYLLVTGMVKKIH